MIDDTIAESPWPESVPGCIIKHPVADLLNKEIDFSVNVLGNRWLERGTYGVIQGEAELGKSVIAVQIAIEAALGRDVFGIKVDAPLRVLLIQAEDSENDLKEQVTGVINNLSLRPGELDLIDENFLFLNPKQKADQGAALFENLRSVFQNVKLDLVILNPAFAFCGGKYEQFRVGGRISPRPSAILLENEGGGGDSYPPRP
jgi:RecA-family ATPase